MDLAAPGAFAAALALSPAELRQLVATEQPDGATPSVSDSGQWHDQLPWEGRGDAAADGAGSCCEGMSCGDSRNDRDNICQTQEGSLTAEERRNFEKYQKQVLRLRRKNRVSQSRYRARIRERRRASNEALTTLQQQLQDMQLSQAALLDRNAALERQLAAAQLQGQSQRPQPHGAHEQSDRPALQQSSQPQGHAAAAAAAPSENSDAGRCCQQYAWCLDEQMQADLDGALQLSDGLLLTVRTDGALRLTQAEVAALPQPALRALWREYMDALAACLLQVSGDATGSAAQRLARLVFESQQLKACVLAACPEGVDTLHAVSGDASAPRQPAEAEWQQMAEAARLSALQLRAMLDLRNCFHRNMGAIAARRTALTLALQAALPLCNRDQCDVAGMYGRSLESAGELSAAVRAEHHNQLQLALAVWRRVLNPMQAAYLDIAAWPAAADVKRFVEALAVEAGEPPATDLLAEGSPCCCSIRSSNCRLNLFFVLQASADRAVLSSVQLHGAN